MRARTLLLFWLALMLAGGTAIIARAWLAAQRTAELEASPLALPAPAKSVLVARLGVQRGQILKSDDLVWQVWPQGTPDKSDVLLRTPPPASLAPVGARHPISAARAVP